MLFPQYFKIAHFRKKEPHKIQKHIIFSVRHIKIKIIRPVQINVKFPCLYYTIKIAKNVRFIKYIKCIKRNTLLLSSWLYRVDSLFDSNHQVASIIDSILSRWEHSVKASLQSKISVLIARGSRVLSGRRGHRGDAVLLAAAAARIRWTRGRKAGSAPARQRQLLEAVLAGRWRKRAKAHLLQGSTC